MKSRSRSDVAIDGGGSGFVGNAHIRRRVIAHVNGGDGRRVVGVPQMPWWMRLVNDRRWEGMVLMTWCRVLFSPVTVLVCLFRDLSKFYVHSLR